MPESRLGFTQPQIEAYYKDRVPRLVRHGGQFRASCPLHSGVRDSLSIEAETGLWTCHSECGSGNIFQFESRLNGLEFIEAVNSINAFLGIGEEKPAEKKHEWQYVEAYDYTGRDGKLLYQVVRYSCKVHAGEKSFRQRRPDPDNEGKWIYSLGATKPVLYRLPELVEAASVVCVEGEKDADNLRALGFVVTTCSGGAEKWQADFSEVLAGKHVTIIPDKDEKGEKHLEKITKTLLPRAASVRVLFAPKGKDASDWIAAGATKEIIQQAIDDAQPIAYVVKSKTTSNEEIERTILSLALRHPDQFELVSERLNSDDFTGKTNKIIFGAMLDAARISSPDPTNTWAAIESSGWDKLCPKEALDALEFAVVGKLSNLSGYCKTLKDFSLKRGVGKASRELDALSKSPELGSEAVAKAEAIVAKLADEKMPDRPLVDLGHVIETIGFEKFLNPYHGETLIETPWRDLNEIIVGLMRGTVTIIAARPSVGKSALAGQMVVHAAERGIRSGYFSLEMKKESVLRRMVSAHSEVSTYAMKKGKMSKEQYERVYASTQHIMDIPLFVADQYGKRVREVKAAIRNHQEGLDLVVLDYFQLMRGSRQKGYPNRREELTEVSTELKNELAIPLNIALVVIASLSRAGKAREDKTPQLSDLYECGQLEYDADLVIAPDRPQMYSKDGDPRNTIAHILKQRDGATGKIELEFVPEYVKFANAKNAFSVDGE